ncbi:MAG: methylmalonyl Co-A mutase-associated GTPase MeaB, partial [Chloroflexi bacterium]|nr:methylmalonyl Co-A mutase-associated GTPase MeaB [Chloroflexota bacterium]
AVGLLEVADLVVVNKGDKPGAQRTAAQLRAMLVAGAGRDSGGPGAGPAGGSGAEPAGGAAGRAWPKRPEVLITTAATGDGVPELLAALDRHRAAARGDGDESGTRQARLARAEAQVWAVVSDRVRQRLGDAARGRATSETLTEVAEHRLDPYAAADRLLEQLGRD